MNFDTLNFKILLPKTSVMEKEAVVIKSTLQVKYQFGMSVYVKSVRFIDRFNKEYSWNNDSKYQRVYTSGGTLKIEVQIPVKGVFSTKKSRVILEIEDSEKHFLYIAKYHQETTDQWYFDGVEKQSYNSGKTYIIEESKLPVGNMGAPVITPDITNDGFSDTDSSEYFYYNDKVTDEDIIEHTTSELKDYVKTVFHEMYYIKSKGGKKYKIANGKCISKHESLYLYVFEMESVLFIAEDSPVKIYLPGAKTVEGTVFIAEGLMVILVMQEDMGDKVPLAHMMVEPWKLLRALAFTISRINYHSSPLCMELIKKGPLLAKKTSLDKIAKGQDNAIAHVKNEPITIIWGPPGTGKTYTMAQIVKNYLCTGKSILIVSHSNISVDVVVKQIVKNLTTQQEKNYLHDGKILRYGYVRDQELQQEKEATSYTYALTHNKTLAARIEAAEKIKEAASKKKMDSDEFFQASNAVKKLKKEVKTYEIYYVGKAQVVATTISKINVDKALIDRRFDIVMFDEASMAYVGQILAAAYHAKSKFVCIGDFNQLAPIALSDAKGKLSRDIFDYLKISDTDDTIRNHPWLVLLDTQRRMHPNIAAFPNEKIYHGLLKTAPMVLNQVTPITELAPAPKQALIYISLNGCYAPAFANDDNSRYNLLSAGIVLKVAMRYAQQGKSVGIITPYAAQSRLIMTMLESVKAKGMQIQCATIHQYQGSENEIIIFDTVENYPFTHPGLLMTSNENRNLMRLMNVAVTRAKGKFIMIGTPYFWESTVTDKKNMAYQLTNYILKNGFVISNQQSGLDHLLEENFKKISFYSKSQDYTNQFVHDIQWASKDIMIMNPGLELTENTLITSVLQNTKKNGVQVVMKCTGKEKLSGIWMIIAKPSNNATMPIVIIDGTILWYGLPDGKGTIGFKGSNISNVCRLQYRIESKEVAKSIATLCNMETVTDEHGNTTTLINAVESLNGSTEKLGEYIEKYHKCPNCKKGYKLKESKGGKGYLVCPNCGNTNYLPIQVVNNYISHNNIICKKHKSDLKTGVSAKGIWIRCIEGDHFLKVSDLN